MDRKAAKKARQSAKRTLKQASASASRPALPVANPRQFREGLAMIAQCMAVHGKRGNPKDFVVLSEHAKLYDGFRVFEVRAKLPEKLKTGDCVWLVDTSTPKQSMKPALVVEDNGASGMVLTDPEGKSEWAQSRFDCYPTAVPGRATPVHKSHLALILGDKLAANWWRPGLGRVLPNTGASAAKRAAEASAPAMDDKTKAAMREAAQAVVQGDLSKANGIVKKTYDELMSRVRDASNRFVFSPGTADGPASVNGLKPGEWRHWENSEDDSQAAVICPKCGTPIHLSVKIHTVAANGFVSPSLVCTKDGCGFHEMIALAAWSEPKQ